MEQTLIYQVQQLLFLNKISFDKAELAFQIQSHPSFPSLHSVTGVLDHFGIDNLALDVPSTADVFHQLPSGCLVQIDTKKKKDFAVFLKRGDKVELITSSKKRAVYSMSQFLEMFTGIIVVIEKSEIGSEEISNSNSLTQGMYTLIAALFVSLMWYSNISLTDLIYLLLSIFGLIISITIIKQELGLQSAISDAFCSSTDTNNDCNAVINSTGSKIAENVSLSDLSVVYFLALTISALFALLSASTFSCLFVLSILASPVVLYSIYVQYFHSKAWCPLCLLIGGILLIQGLIAGFNFSEIFANSDFIIPALFLLTAGLGSTLLWNSISPKINIFLELKQIKIDYYKFKRNFDLFKTALEKSPRLSTTIDSKSEIIFGNIHAPLSIVLVTSPFCGHCRPVHQQMEEILAKYGKEVAITVRFIVSNNNRDSDLFKITTRLIEIFHTEGSDACLKAMNEIYSGMETRHWFASWGDCKNIRQYSKVLESQNDWCHHNSINFTPNILVAGRSFPNEYERKDLILFIEDLVEDISEEVAPSHIPNNI